MDTDTSASLEWLSLFLHDDFSSMYEILDNLERDAGARLDAVVAELKDSTGEGPGNEADDEYLSYQHYELTELHPQLLRRALVMLAYAKTEHRLHDICVACFHDGISLQKAPEDVYVKASHKYLRDTLGKEYAATSKGWIYLDLLRKVRNVFVHSNGMLGHDGTSLNIRAFVDANPDAGIRCGNGDAIVMTKEFVHHAIKQMQQLLEETLSIAQGRLTRPQVSNPRPG
jgi:hypothetical protein